MLFLKRGVGKCIPALLFVLFTTLLVACGSTTSTTTGNVAATNTPTKTVCPTVTAVTITSVSATQLQGTTQAGKDVQVTFTDKTTFIHPATLTPADIKTGSTVVVTVKQNADSTYTALTINSGGFSGGRQGGYPRGGGANGCGGQRRGSGGFGGGSGTPGAGGTQSRQVVSGTVNQISNTSMTLTDASGNDYTIAITSTTRINSQKTITASDLKAGQIVSIIGTADTQGGIAASSVSVLQSFPRRNAAPTPTVSVQ